MSNSNVRVVFSPLTPSEKKVWHQSDPNLVPMNFFSHENEDYEVRRVIPATHNKKKTYMVMPSYGYPVSAN